MITCVNPRIINGGAKINLNAKDGEGNLVPSIIWKKGKTEQIETDTISEDSTLTYNSIVTQKTETESIKYFLKLTKNFSI